MVTDTADAVLKKTVTYPFFGLYAINMPLRDDSGKDTASLYTSFVILVLRTVKQAGRLGLLLVQWKYPNITRRGF